MTIRRTARVNRAIQEAVSTAVLFKLKDPRVKNVTVLRAEATDDLRQAKVYVSVMGDEKRQILTMKGLNSARGFIQSKVADRLQTKQTPVLTFVLDHTVKLDLATQAALSQLFPVPPTDALDDLADDEDLDDEDLDDEDVDDEDVDDEDVDDEDVDDEDVDDDEFDDDDVEDDADETAELEEHEELPSHE